MNFNPHSSARGDDLAYSRMNSDEWKRNNPESYKAVEIGDKVLMKKKTNLTLCGEMKDCVGKVCTIKGFDGAGIELKESGTFLFTQIDIKGKVIQ